jgi:hypothetical protein
VDARDYGNQNNGRDQAIFYAFDGIHLDVPTKGQQN